MSGVCKVVVVGFLHLASADCRWGDMGFVCGRCVELSTALLCLFAPRCV